MESKPFFEIPDENRLLRAIGDNSHLSDKDYIVLQTYIKHSKIIQKPKKGDWLAEHKEFGQGFKKFKEEFVSTDLTKKYMYILPLEQEISLQFVSNLKLVCEAFYFGIQVKIMDYADMNKWQIESRINDDSFKKQYDARQILDKILTIKPKDAYCLIAVTLTDLYPQPEWNFVFGLADIRCQVGVFSFARYNDRFYNPSGKVDQDKIFFRSCKVMVHEFGHQYNMRHCIFYQCIMNGSNHLQESDQKPFDLCPVCLKKLQLVLKFDFLTRFQALQSVFSQLGGHYFKNEEILIQQITMDVDIALNQGIKQQTKENKDQQQNKINQNAQKKK